MKLQFGFEASDLVDAAPVSIVGNAELDAFCAGNGTNGSITNPHVIKEYRFTSTTSSYGIKLVNTTRYLVIEQNAFENITYVENIYETAGIKLSNASHITIRNNTFLTSFNGVAIQSGSNISITNNTFYRSTFAGVVMNDSAAIEMKRNHFLNCGLFVLGNLSQLLSLDIDATNKINTRGSIYYMTNKAGFLGQDIQDGGQVFLVNCSNIEIHDLSFGHSTIGLLLLYSSNITVRGNTFDTHNLYCLGSFETNNSVFRDNVMSTAVYSLAILESSYMLVENNTVTNSIFDGIVVGASNHVTISRNHLDNNTQYNIKIYASHHTTISHNLANQSKHGIACAWDNTDATIIGNRVSNALDNGIHLALSSNIIVRGNELVSNLKGLQLENTNNVTAFLNNFVGSIESHISDLVTTNFSLNCTGWGNYWDDYTTRYPNATQTANGTWLTPNVLQVLGNYTDYHPLVAPNIVPWIDFKVDDANVDAGTPVRFSFSGVAGDAPLDILWDFGDGHQDAAGLNPSHVYTTPGKYTVSLFIRDKHGEDDYLVFTDYIDVGPYDGDGYNVAGMVATLCIAIGLTATGVYFAILRRKRSIR